MENRGGLVEVDYFDLVVFEAALGKVALDEVDHFGDYLVSMARARAYAGNAYNGALPVLVVTHFRGGHVKLAYGAGEQGLHVLSLVFERVVFGQVEYDSGGANDHRRGFRGRRAAGDEEVICLEAPSGFEPLVELLQSSALPLGHGAPGRFNLPYRHDCVKFAKMRAAPV